MRGDGNESCVASLRQETFATPDEEYFHQSKQEAHAIRHVHGNEGGVCVRATNNEPRLSRCFSDIPRTDGFLDTCLGR